MTLVVAVYKETVIGIYTDINRAQRAAKEAFPHAYKRVRYLPFVVNDGIDSNETAVSAS